MADESPFQLDLNESSGVYEACVSLRDAIDELTEALEALAADPGSESLRLEVRRLRDTASAKTDELHKVEPWRLTARAFGLAEGESLG